LNKREKQILIEKAYRQGWRDSVRYTNPKIPIFSKSESENECVKKLLTEIDSKN